MTSGEWPLFRDGSAPMKLEQGCLTQLTTKGLEFGEAVKTPLFQVLARRCFVIDAMPTLYVTSWCSGTTVSIQTNHPLLAIGTTDPNCNFRGNKTVARYQQEGYPLTCNICTIHLTLSLSTDRRMTMVPPYLCLHSLCSLLCWSPRPGRSAEQT